LLLKILKIIFVQDHTVIFEAEAAVELRIGGEFVLIHPAILQHLCDFFIQFVDAFDISLVQLEMRFKCLVRNALQATEIKLPGLIRCCLEHDASLPSKDWLQMPFRLGLCILGGRCWWQVEIKKESKDIPDPDVVV